MRIAIGGILHETSTCVSTRTTLRDFEYDRGIIRGNDMLDRFRAANVCTGGFIQGAEKHGFEPVPLLRASAFPGGLIDREDYESIKVELLECLAVAETEGGRVDGVLLDLHGAMVVEGIDDGDGDVIGAVRQVIGPDRPIVVTQDLHGNHTRLRVELADALKEGERIGRYPIILADHADNTGGGSPGDSTEVLRTFLEMGLQDALLLYMVDPGVAKQAHAVRVGNRISVSLGGKSDPVQGPPIEAEAEVVALSDGRFSYDGPMFAGLTGNMGTSAWLRIDRVSVVVACAREQPFDLAFVRSLGIDCRDMKYIALKSAAHFRAAFEPIAGSIHNVDAAGIHTHEFDKLPFRKRTRPVFPVEIAPAAE